MSNSPCIQPEIEQISTGQAGVEINRDLEQLFAAVNKLIRCVAKLATFANSVSSGSFGSGVSGGETGGVSSGVGTVNGGPSSPSGNMMILSTGSAATLPDGGGKAAIDATAAINVTLGTPGIFEEWFIQNTNATNSITLKDDLGNTIATIAPGQYTRVNTMQTAAGANAWPTGVTVFSQTGVVYIANDVVFRSSSDGPCLIDSGTSHFVRQFTSGGSILGTDLGTSEPA